jgi:hypothetical protein
MECSTVLWCLPPNSRPISTSVAPVSRLAMWRSAHTKERLRKSTLTRYSFRNSSKLTVFLSD